MSGASLLDDNTSTSTLTFTAKDASDALVTGLTDVTFLLTGLTGASISAVTETPAKSGIYVAKLKSSKAGPVTVAAAQGSTAIAGLATKSVTFTHKVGAISGADSTLTSAQDTLAGDGTAKTAISFTAKDATGAVITGLSNISFALTGAGAATASLSPAKPAENPAGSGIYVADLSNTAAGLVTITVKQGTTAVAGLATKDVTFS